MIWYFLLILHFWLDLKKFKEGIQPMWEDKSNKEGGKWTVNFKGAERISSNDIWLLLVYLPIFL